MVGHQGNHRVQWRNLLQQPCSDLGVALDDTAFGDAEPPFLAENPVGYADLADVVHESGDSNCRLLVVWALHRFGQPESQLGNRARMRVRVRILGFDRVHQHFEGFSHERAVERSVGGFLEQREDVANRDLSIR